MKLFRNRLNIDNIRHISHGRRASVICAAVLLASSANAQAPAKTAESISQPVISGSQSIADAVQNTLKYNPMILAAGDQTSAAKARVGMARAMTKPQLSATGFAGTSSMGDIVTSPPNVMPSSVFNIPGKGSVTGQAGLMVPLYTGGRLSNAVRGAEALSTAAASDSKSITQNATLETKTAYHAALLAQSTVDVYRNLVQEEQERVRIAEASYKEGRIAKYDLLRNQTGLAEAQQKLANAERDSQVAMINLKTAIGVDPASDITLSDQLAYAQIPGALDSYLDSALKNRPEIEAAKVRTKSAEANIDVAKSAFKPQVYANVMGGVSASSDGTDTGLTAGVSIGLPILDGGLRRSSVKEAEAMRNSMKRDEQQATLMVQQDVNTVWAELQAADKNVQLSEAAVAQADEDYRVIKLRYESGKAVNVEVLDALESLIMAQNNRLMALYEHNVARDRLARAIGEI